MAVQKTALEMFDEEPRGADGQFTLDLGPLASRRRAMSSLDLSGTAPHSRSSVAPSPAGAVRQDIGRQAYIALSESDPEKRLHAQMELQRLMRKLEEIISKELTAQ